ncbi:MAG TPA: DUF5819 family protein [Candidatus Elarobacter sp.]|nr:DUF5819 family protein [Candidatus Elarobacter sp.]HEV2738975.1 DUF5819 family protein [Candidatus Elarobacter sp.]
MIQTRDRVAAPQMFVAAAALFVLVMHTLLTFMINIPANMITTKVSKHAYGYMFPYFSQSWSLFAPNPGEWNPGAAFRFAYRGQDGRLSMTQWYDANALFPVGDAANPLNRLGLEREIYFGEVLIASNGIKKIRASVQKKRTDVGHPVDVAALPSTMLSLERLFMSLADQLLPTRAGSPFLVQVALREQRPDSFDEHAKPPAERRTESSVPTLLMPWVVGQRVSPFI